MSCLSSIAAQIDSLPYKWELEGGASDEPKMGAECKVRCGELILNFERKGECAGKRMGR